MDKVIIDGVDVSECSYCFNNQLKGKGHAPAKSMPYAKETSCIACKEDITRLNFCKNNPNCYYKQLKRLQQENEKLKQVANDSIIEQEKLIAKVNELQAENDNLKDDIDKQQLYVDSLEQENEKLKFELKSEQKDNKYIKNCCIRAGKELEKYSFKWDGKEKNLVVQALELNEQYDKLQAENERLKNEHLVKSYEYNYSKQLINTYKQALQEIRDIVDKNISFMDTASTTKAMIRIQDKINSVIGAEE